MQNQIILENFGEVEESEQVGRTNSLLKGEGASNKLKKDVKLDLDGLIFRLIKNVEIVAGKLVRGKNQPTVQTNKRNTLVEKTRIGQKAQIKNSAP